ncbi:MAG: hypothetical protein K5686_04060 [Lachnospiraceae bacterium]|nr:hypothetical protein [Lachnospiraceae bacterium]
MHGHSLSFNMLMHDYVYYPHGWTNDQGVSYREGYYDENGQYYANMVAKGVQTNLLCTYCGNHMVYTWQEGMVPTCDKCGGVFQIDIQDAPQQQQSTRKQHGKIFAFIAAVYLLMILGSCTFKAAAFIWALTSDGKRDESYTERTTEAYDTGTASDAGQAAGTLPKSIYVEEIGRKCYPDGENMYDRVSDCWFWFNTELLPAQWQYWYEGISSDFGDYGWMEYDDEEGKWYVEVADGDWQELSGYDTSNLWHFKDAYVNEYY